MRSRAAGNTAPELEVRLLGHASVIVAGAPVKLAKRTTTLAMLALLVLRRGRPIARDTLAFTLFPDWDEMAARDGLRHYLSQANKALRTRTGEPWLISDAETVRWNGAAGAFVDVIEFERLAANALTRAAAVELYAGDLLEDVYDDWVVTERERLRMLYLQVLQDLVAAHRSARNNVAALTYVRRFLSTEPWREDMVRQAMAIHYALGDSSGALTAYDRFAKHLRAEMGTQPMPETLALREAILHGEALIGSVDAELSERADHAGHQPIRVLPFIGRERERAAMRARWDAAAGGAGGVLLVSGEAGVGKTRLVRELAEQAEAQGAGVYTGSTSSPESFPYQCIAEALRAALPVLTACSIDLLTLAVLSRILPELHAQAGDLPEVAVLEPDRESARLFASVAAAVVCLASPRPLLLVFEDLHWASGATIDALAAVVRPIHGGRVLIVVTYRQDETPASHPIRVLADALGAKRRAVELHLERFTRDDVAQLVGHLDDLGERDEAVVDRLYALSEGNSLFLNEAIADAAESANTLFSESGSPLSGIAGVIATQTARLGSAARMVAEISAICGQGCSVDVVRDVSGISTAQTLEALDELLDRRLVREAGARERFDYVFTHHLIRASIYEQIDAEKRERRHARVAYVLEERAARRAGVMRERARHYDLAGKVLPNNLPLQLTTFIGRAAETGAIGSLIEKNRLVTLVGSGGIGKTRTSLQVAAQLLDGFGGGVWFVELAPLTSGDHIASTVALALRLTLAPEGDPVESLVGALNGKHALLVFDNCEHLIEPAARLISAILDACPDVKVLASSRQRLGIVGEATYRMPSLAVPSKDEAAHLNAIDLARYESVELFVERAVAASDVFSLTDDNAPIVADICRRLDGIPLAIELAAVRVKVLSPQQLRERLDERFRVLTDDDRSALPRHQTLRALIDWSHDLLDEQERTLFRRVGIFVSAFTVEGAVAVGSGEDINAFDVFDVLASLVDKSLVFAEPYSDTLRYRLLESTRAYALEKLADARERDLVAGRHLRYLRDHFRELGEQRERSARAVDLDEVLQIELEDVRWALDDALVRSEVVDGGELLAAIDRTWRANGLDAEGVARCKAYLAALPVDQRRLRARLSSALSYLLWMSGHKARALELATEAVEQARQSDDATLAWALAHQGYAAAALRQFDDAERALAEAEAIPGTSAYLRIWLLQVRQSVAWFRGDLETAARIFEQLRKEHRSLGNTRGEHNAALNLAEIEHARGQTQRAIAIVQGTLPAARSTGDALLLANLLHNLAGYLVAADDLPGAAAAACETIQIRAAREPDHPYVAVGMEHLALVFALRGDLARAATFEGYVDAAFHRHGNDREFTEATTHDRLNSLLHTGLAPNELARLIAAGAALTPESAIALALQEHEST